MADVLLGVALSVAAAYVVAVAYLYRRLFVPSPARRDEELELTPWEFHADYEDFDLVTADGIGFGGWFLRQPGSPQTVVVSSGHKGLRDDCLGVAVALWRKGFNVLLYSYRGTPGSD